MSELACGGFRLGPLRLALPMAALREVVPCTALQPLPSAAPCVLGVLHLRGQALPVVDLRVLLGQPAAAPASVLVMQHAGRLLGLGVDTVGAVFHSPVQALSTQGDGLAPLVEGSVTDEQGLLTLLSPAALAALPQVPMALAQPAVQSAAPGAAGTPGSQALPLMLLRCGGVPLAVAAMAVDATLAAPRVDSSSALAVGHCRGVISHAGAELPAIDLLGLCGLGQLDPQQAELQAFVLRLPQGRVALLVDAVLDVVRVRAQDVLPLPAFALPRPALFAGALPAEALAGPAGQPCLLLDAVALAEHPELAALAGMHASSQQASAAAAAALPSQRMITYRLGVETATPIEQVAEILPYAPGLAGYSAQGSLLGLMFHRGRSIPVLCLSRLAGGCAPQGAMGASVLVVQSEGEHVGFAVQQLQSIETATWQPASGGQRHAMALFGRGAEERMLPVLDLQALARQARAGLLQAH